MDDGSEVLDLGGIEDEGGVRLDAPAVCVHVHVVEKDANEESHHPKEVPHVLATIHPHPHSQVPEEDNKIHPVV